MLPTNNELGIARNETEGNNLETGVAVSSLVRLAAERAKLRALARAGALAGSLVLATTAVGLDVSKALAGIDRPLYRLCQCER